MGTITESFVNLTDYLLTEHKKAKKSSDTQIITDHLLKPLLPTNIRVGTGVVADIKDRQVGPFDVVATVDGLPPFGAGSASTFLADGMVFILQVKDWAENDLTQFAQMAEHVKKLDRKKQVPVPCLAVSFKELPLTEISQLLNSKTGQAIDGVLSV